MKKALIIVLILAVVGCFTALYFLHLQREQVIFEKDLTTSDYVTYTDKKSECSGTANTTNSYINQAGLTDCGGKLAIDASLTMASLYDIYHNYCNRGFGVAVYGCTIPLTRKVYICKPGTTLYDRRNTYVSYYYIRYQYISYACNDVDIGNTIRHELLHLVYLGLTEVAQERVSSKLSTYKSQYAQQLAAYTTSEQDDELFVRVGADGRHVDDIEIIDLYSQVSTAYVAQKQKYYEQLAYVANSYRHKYDELSENYSTLQTIVVILIVINIFVLIVAIFTHKKPGGERPRKERNPPKREGNKKVNSHDSETFDEFKKKYGITDIHDM